MEGVGRDVVDGGGGRDVVHKAAHRDELALGALGLLPTAEELHEEVAAVALVEELGDEVEVRHEGGLEDDGHVGRVEQLDGVRLLHAAAALGADGEVHAEALEVDHDEEHEDGGQEVGAVGQVLAVEGLLEGAGLVRAGKEQMEEGDDGALELRPTPLVDGGGGERLPDDVLADVGGDEEGDTGAETVALLEELVEADDNDAGHEELEDDENRVASTELADVAVHARDHVRDGLTNGDEDAEKLLRAVHESPVLLHGVVNLDDLGSSEELDYQPRRHDRGDTELHARPAIGRHDNAGPVEGVGARVGLDAIER
mmetsp:Transcript_44817/g.142710  ORF Transcript_44817/g.142710 Transcript_44817/m.142710 type:complete len:313 (-) Transcript_44817:240-1178(-)